MFQLLLAAMWLLIRIPGRVELENLSAAVPPVFSETSEYPSSPFDFIKLPCLSFLARDLLCASTLVAFPEVIIHRCNTSFVPLATLFGISTCISPMLMVISSRYNDRCTQITCNNEHQRCQIIAEWTEIFKVAHLCDVPIVPGLMGVRIQNLSIFSLSFFIQLSQVSAILVSFSFLPHGGHR